MNQDESASLERYYQELPDMRYQTMSGGVSGSPQAATTQDITEDTTENTTLGDGDSGVKDRYISTLERDNAQLRAELKLYQDYVASTLGSQLPPITSSILPSAVVPRAMSSAPSTPPRSAPSTPPRMRSAPSTPPRMQSAPSTPPRMQSASFTAQHGRSLPQYGHQVHTSTHLEGRESGVGASCTWPVQSYRRPSIPRSLDLGTGPLGAPPVYAHQTTASQSQEVRMDDGTCCRPLSECTMTEGEVMAFVRDHVTVSTQRSGACEVTINSTESPFILRGIMRAYNHYVVLNGIKPLFEYGATNSLIAPYKCRYVISRCIIHGSGLYCDGSCGCYHQINIGTGSKEICRFHGRVIGDVIQGEGCVKFIIMRCKEGDRCTSVHSPDISEDIVESY